MSQATTPFSVVFDMQRNAIEQTQDVIAHSVTTQRELRSAMFDFGPAKEANERSYEAVQTVVDAYFDAMESMTPMEEDALADVRAAVENQLDTFEASQVEALETVETTVRDGNDSMADLTEEFNAVLDDQFDAMLETHAEVEGSLADLAQRIETLNEESAERALAGDSATDSAADAEAASGEADVADETDAGDDSLESIDGLGPTYAGRLRDQGIESIADLAETSAITVAEAADAPEATAEEWIETAQSWT